METLISPEPDSEQPGEGEEQQDGDSENGFTTAAIQDNPYPHPTRDYHAQVKGGQGCAEDIKEGPRPRKADKDVVITPILVRVVRIDGSQKRVSGK